MARVPSNMQIKLVESITEAFNLDFPQTSEDFTSRTYSKFIVNHLGELWKVLNKQYKA